MKNIVLKENKKLHRIYRRFLLSGSAFIGMSRFKVDLISLGLWKLCVHSLNHSQKLHHIKPYTVLKQKRIGGIVISLRVYFLVIILSLKRHILQMAYF